MLSEGEEECEVLFDLNFSFLTFNFSYDIILDNRGNCGDWNYLVRNDKKERGGIIAKKTRRTNTTTATRNTNNVKQVPVDNEGKIKENKIRITKVGKKIEKRLLINKLCL